MIKNILFVLLTLLSMKSSSQQPILVTESTIILDFDQNKEIFFSFAEGDEIIFNMEMVKGKHIKEVEVIEMPTNTILTEFKSKGVSNKKIQIRNKGIYKFRFYSSSLTRRVCKIKIHRKPANETTKNFNTNWKWKVVKDSIYVPYKKDSLVGYKTVKYQETIRELKETKIEEIMLFEKTESINRNLIGFVSRSHVKVNLPILNSNNLREEKLLAWSYWIGVDQESREAYKANYEGITKLVNGVASTFTSPLGGLVLGEITSLMLPQTGEAVEYYFVSNYENVQKFYRDEQFLQFDMGKVRAAYGVNDRLKKGTFYIALHNVNRVQSIEVDVKVLAVKEIKLYEYITYNKEREEPQYVTLDKKRLEIKETRFRIPVE